MLFSFDLGIIKISDDSRCINSSQDAQNVIKWTALSLRACGDQTSNRVLRITACGCKPRGPNVLWEKLIYVKAVFYGQTSLPHTHPHRLKCIFGH